MGLYVGFVVFVSDIGQYDLVLLVVAISLSIVFNVHAFSILLSENITCHNFHILNCGI